MTAFSLDRYFERIQFRGVADATLATVADVMRCQMQHVPFENLDIQAGKIISLDHGDIVEKLLTRQRGGYCYEVNGLFAMALEALHIPYFFVAARPAAHGVKKPKIHMAVIVQCDGENWLCDCGFGGYGIRAPMRVNVFDTPVSHDGELCMITRDGADEFLLQTKVHDDWEALYVFDLTPQNWEDFAPANLYNSTDRDSFFVRKLLVVICTPNGRKILLGNALKIISNGKTEKRLLAPEQRAVVLREEFGLLALPSQENLLIG
ncbi:N-hydroxyarylamine O-acetyltransferase [Oxalobacteraceae bacterium GrIS 1.18]